MKILAHLPFIGTTGYANHARSFFCALNKYHTIKVRKTLAYGSFIFSIFVILLFLFSGSLINPTHWLWTLPAFISLLNLTAMTSKFYRIYKKKS